MAMPRETIRCEFVLGSECIRVVTCWRKFDCRWRCSGTSERNGEARVLRVDLKLEHVILQRRSMYAGFSLVDRGLTIHYCRKGGMESFAEYYHGKYEGNGRTLDSGREWTAGFSFA